VLDATEVLRRQNLYGRFRGLLIETT
jgi:hypothetical protein